MKAAVVPFLSKIREFELAIYGNSAMT